MSKPDNQGVELGTVHVTLGVVLFAGMLVALRLAYQAAVAAHSERPFELFATITAGFMPALAMVSPKVFGRISPASVRIGCIGALLATAIVAGYVAAWCSFVKSAYGVDVPSPNSMPQVLENMAVLSTIGQTIVVGLVISKLGAAEPAADPKKEDKANGTEPP